MSTLVGHGKLGSEIALRDFVNLIDQSSHQKDVIAEIRPITVVSMWAVESGTTYVTGFEKFFDGVRLDVVGVQSLLDTGLTRVETLAECNSTPGTYFYDVDIEFNGSATQWDIVGNFWDIDPEDKWDQFPRLFIHLFDGSDPNSTTVVAKSGFYYATRSMVQPALGPRKELNGDFENWTGGFLDDWTLEGTGLQFWDDTVTLWDGGDFWDPVLSFIEQETTVVKVGTSAVKMMPENSETVTLKQVMTGFVVGKRYRVAGFYNVDHRTGLGVIQIKDNLSASWIDVDGRSTDSSAVDFNFTDTAGDYRRFIIDFRAHSTEIEFSLIAEGQGSGALVYWDDFAVKRIWRFNKYHPRISAGSVPRSQSGSNDIFFGGKRIGSGGVSLINSDGQLERLVAEFEWMNQEVIIKSGGAFSDGQELHIDDYRQTFAGLIQRISINDEEANFQLQDLRAFFHILLPPRVYNDTEFPNMNTQKSLGVVRPLFFGVKRNIDPVRINLTANGYGIYELCDTTDSPNGIKAIDDIFAYLDQSAADSRDPSNRITLTPLDYSVDLGTSQITILRDVGPYEITDENNLLDFDIGAGEITAILTEGIFSATALAAEIQTQMIAVGAGDEVCTYSDVTHKITIGKGAGTLDLLMKTGSNKTLSPFKTLGYKTNLDKTGLLSYEAEKEIFTSADRRHFIRVDAQGFKDDIAGTYTAVPNGLIEIGSDIMRVLLTKYMNKSPSVIDEISFTFARDRAPESLTIYLKSAISTKNIFDIMEFSNIANIIVNGEGKVFYKVYVGEIPANIKTINDRDIQEFDSERSTQSIYNTIRVKYDQDPTSGNFQTRQAEDNSVQIRLGRPDIREFETFIKQADNANSAANRLLELARSAARKITTTTLGGQFVDLEVGDKVKLNRKRALGLGGVIVDEVFRIISISKAQQDGVVDMELTDDRITVASQACIQECQAFCQSTCQQLCEQACQETCQITCQDSCEASCQQSCEVGCQETCQLGCQLTCETGCQTTCQQSCQGSCEGMGCQTVCETSSCQLACQLACQTVCQATCQGACQTGCQDTCQVSCQSGCEITCQTACQTGCQTTCQLNCQQSCEFSCQSGCQQQDCQFASESPE